MATRFRGFLPVVIDVETGGFNSKTDALLEIGAVIVGFDDSGELVRKETHRFHVKPFEGANIEAASLAVNGIDPNVYCVTGIGLKGVEVAKQVHCRARNIVGHIIHAGRLPLRERQPPENRDRQRRADRALRAETAGNDGGG